MNKLLLFLFVCLLEIYVKCDSNLNNCGKDWTPALNENCYQVIHKKLNFEEAEEECKKLKATLISIESEDEQKFFNKQLSVYNKETNTVWIGLKYRDNEYKWSDGTNTSAYHNWSSDALHDGTVHCVRMSISKSNKGAWTDDVCTRKYMAVCQKKEKWNLDNLEEAIAKIYKDWQKEVDKRNKNADALPDNTKYNTVPKGFIYIQLPFQTEPKILWPYTEWTEVSAEYASLFFRVEGSKAEKFEKSEPQKADQAMITKVSSSSGGDYDKYHFTDFRNITLPLGKWSEDLYQTGFLEGLLFYTDDEENRPINRAVKVWKKIN